MDNKSFYKKLLFQISFEDNHYLGTFTYDFLKYSYFTYIEDNKKKETNIENSTNLSKKKSKKTTSSVVTKKYNENLTKYVSFFMNLFLKDKKYDIYFLSELYDNPENNSLLNIEFDNRVHIQCILDQKNKNFHFLDYHIENSDFEAIENEIYTTNNIWDFSDYGLEEIPFTEPIYRGLEKKLKSKKKSASGYESGSDEEDHNKFLEDCVKYENHEQYYFYSSEFRNKVVNDASDKIRFFCNLSHKVKNNNKKLYEHCRIKKATQICRKFIYENKNLFRLRHLFIVKDFHIDNEDNLNTDFDNNEEIDVNISFELESKCGQFKSDGEISKYGCYDNGGFDTSTHIEYIQDIHRKTLRELYLTLFDRFNPLDI